MLKFCETWVWLCWCSGSWTSWTSSFHLRWTDGHLSLCSAAKRCVTIHVQISLGAFLMIKTIETLNGIMQHTGRKEAWKRQQRTSCRPGTVSTAVSRWCTAADLLMQSWVFHSSSICHPLSHLSSHSSCSPPRSLLLWKHFCLKKTKRLILGSKRGEKKSPGVIHTISSCYFTHLFCDPTYHVSLFCNVNTDFTKGAVKI